MTLPPYMKVQGDVIHVAVKVQPRASRNAIAGVLGGELKIQVTAPPVDSAANEALVEFLADLLNCPRGAVQMVRGATSRHKTMALRGLAVEQVVKILGA